MTPSIDRRYGGGGGYGGLLDFTSMAPSAVSFGMTGRIPTQPLMQGRF
jgi:hypothetical protein